MKRSFLTLTAIVLAAILLAGCQLLPWSSIKLGYVLEENVFEKVTEPARVKKNTGVHLVFPFREEAKGQYNLKSFAFEVKAGDKEVEYLPAEIRDADDKVIGIYVDIPDVGDKDLTIKILIPKG